MRRNGAHPGIKTTEQRVKERCVLRQEQQRALLLPGSRKLAQYRRHGARTGVEPTPGPAVDGAVICNEGEGAVVRPGAGMTLQPMRKRGAVHAGVWFARPSQVRHHPSLKFHEYLPPQAAAFIEQKRPIF